MARLRVPINPAVVRWAITESGLTPSDIAARLKRPNEEVAGWMSGEVQPTQAQLRNLADQLRRPSALFYLPEAPTGLAVPPSLRRAPGLGDHRLTVDEVRQIRWMVRLQRTLSWLAEDAADPVELPELRPGMTPEQAADEARAWLGVSLARQLRWPDARRALEAWRAAVEDRGVIVAQFQIDKQAIRGFSVWDDYVPLIAVNTAYTPQARAFTMFHELGHLVRRDGSACIGFAGPDDPRPDERWCERFAAALLLPRDHVLDVGRSALMLSGAEEAVYRSVQKVAREFKTSVRATALRLIELGTAPQSLYDLIDRYQSSAYDDFPKPSNGGGGQTAAEKRLVQLGHKVVGRLLGAAEDGSLTSRDVGDYLHLSPTQVGDLIGLVGQ